MSEELNYTVAMKLVDGSELIALLIENDDHIVKVEFPYAIRYDKTLRGVTLYPYCLWSTEQIFTFTMDKVMYIVSCDEEVANRYLDLVDELQIKKHIKDTSELEQSLDKLEAFLSGDKEEIEYKEQPILIEGNDTKH